MTDALAYHQLIATYFSANKNLWVFFENIENKQEQQAALKLGLLKNAYKFTPEDAPALYTAATAATEKLGMPLPVIIYQSHNKDELNASVIFTTGEIHILFSGNMLQSLDNTELQAVIAHEVSHVLLYRQSNGQIETASRLMHAIGSHAGSSPAHYESARLFQLYTEIYCDRGAYTVLEDYKPIVTSLVKIATGLAAVNADSYIKQAEEIFTSDAATKTTGITHPENFIRARAIWLWHTQGKAAEEEIKKMIEGQMHIDELDLIQQQRLTGLTRRLLGLILQPLWMRTAQNMALANQYFALPEPPAATPDEVENIAKELAALHPTLQDYAAQVMYDFTTADNEITEPALGHCFALADALALQDAFANIVKKEKKLTLRKVAALKKQSIETMRKAG